MRGAAACARRSVPGGGGYFHCQGVARADGGAVLCNNSRSLTRRARWYARNLMARATPPATDDNDDAATVTRKRRMTHCARAHIYSTTFGRGNHLSIRASATPPRSTHRDSPPPYSPRRYLIFNLDQKEHTCVDKKISSTRPYHSAISVANMTVKTQMISITMYKNIIRHYVWSEFFPPINWFDRKTRRNTRCS